MEREAGEKKGDKVREKKKGRYSVGKCDGKGK